MCMDTYLLSIRSLEFTWYRLLLDSLIGALSCAPHNFYYSLLLPQLHSCRSIDCKGEEVSGYIIDILLHHSQLNHRQSITFGQRQLPLTEQEHWIIVIQLFAVHCRISHSLTIVVHSFHPSYPWAWALVIWEGLTGYEPKYSSLFPRWLTS